jgi:hypothetical protein
MLLQLCEYFLGNGHVECHGICVPQYGCERGGRDILVSGTRRGVEDGGDVGRSYVCLRLVDS